MNQGEDETQIAMEEQQEQLEQKRKARDKQIQKRRLQGLKSAGFGVPSLFEGFDDSGFTGNRATLG